jgi:hypothetical protein
MDAIEEFGWSSVVSFGDDIVAAYQSPAQEHIAEVLDKGAGSYVLIMGAYIVPSPGYGESRLCRTPKEVRDVIRAITPHGRNRHWSTMKALPRKGKPT